MRLIWVTKIKKDGVLLGSSGYLYCKHLKSIHMNMQQKRKRVSERIDLRWSVVIIVIALLGMAMCTSCSSPSGDRARRTTIAEPTITGQAFIADLNSLDSTAILVSSEYTDTHYSFIIKQNDSLFTYKVNRDEFSKVMFVTMIEGRTIK
jgi:hypothetical protein